MSVDVIDLVLIALFSGVGNSGGQWVFKRFVEPHLEEYQERVRQSMRDRVAVQHQYRDTGIHRDEWRK